MRQKMIDLALGYPTIEYSEASAFAAAAVSAVRLILLELRPIVGDLATQAMYVRALHLARSAFKRPAPVEPFSLDALLAPLRDDLSSRELGKSCQAGQALILALVDLLVSLIGLDLTYRMLRTAWNISIHDLPPEEKSR